MCKPFLYLGIWVETKGTYLGLTIIALSLSTSLSSEDDLGLSTGIDALVASSDVQE